MKDTTTPSLGAVINDGMKRRLAAVRVALPARVLRYDPATCKAQVQPVIYEEFLDENGDRQFEDAPVINDVPVVMPGSGGVRIKFPIAAGDTVLLVFASSNIDRWLALGGSQPPGDTRHHDLADAIAIPGLQSLADADDNSPLIEFTGDEIHAGGSSKLALQAELSAIRTWLATHTHAFASLGTPSPPVQVATLPSVPGTDVLKGA